MVQQNGFGGRLRQVTRHAGGEVASHRNAAGGYPTLIAAQRKGSRVLAKAKATRTVEAVIAELAQRQAELGTPEAHVKATSPAQVVSRALGYLQNHKDRLRYAAYRQQGLPIVSSYVESAVKQFNYRVKGTEKFWREEGAEEILQLRADYLSDGNPLEAFWKTPASQ